MRDGVGSIDAIGAATPVDRPDSHA